ncbi:hypothetical protein X801_03722, partial [Opisthorchis viverrini]
MHERKERFADSVEEVEQYTKDALNCQLRVYAFFIGTTDPKTGDSWCPDCRTAEPIVEEGTKKMSEKDLFIMCEVGDRDQFDLTETLALQKQSAVRPPRAQAPDCKALLQMCQRERFADSVELVEKYTKDALNQQRRVFAFFIGTMDPNTGDSWCPDSRADLISNVAINKRFTESTSV